MHRLQTETPHLRSMKAIGFDWFDQFEPAKGFEDPWMPPSE
jgi:hypothetical protein